jgi:hypothetical protein
MNRVDHFLKDLRQIGKTYIEGSVLKLPLRAVTALRTHLMETPYSGAFPWTFQNTAECRDNHPPSK